MKIFIIIYFVVSIILTTAMLAVQKMMLKIDEERMPCGKWIFLALSLLIFSPAMAIAVVALNLIEEIRKSSKIK